MSVVDTDVNDLADARELVEQYTVELAVLLGIENALRIALQWKPRDNKIIYKLSTLRFHAWSFERHLARIVIMADHGGYLNLITETSPHLASNVASLKSDRAKLHDRLDCIILRLDHVAHDDAGELGRICADFECFLDDLRTHGQREGELRQHSFSQEEGGPG